jgi:hypothetical protein
MATYDAERSPRSSSYAYHRPLGCSMNNMPLFLVGSARSVLDAFFYGRAFAETVNERLGLAMDDLLSDFGKWDAERRQALRYANALLLAHPIRPTSGI